MKPRTAPDLPLDDTTRKILLFGPFSVGKTLHDVQHDQLRVLWRLHRESLLASWRGPGRPWFESRDRFVAIARGEADR